jgi:hypothetical protein
MAARLASAIKRWAGQPGGVVDVAVTADDGLDSGRIPGGAGSQCPGGSRPCRWQVARLAALRSRRARRTRVGPAGRPTVPSCSVRVGSIGLECLPGHLRQQHVPGFGRHTASCRTGPRSGPAFAAAAARRWRACGTWPRRRWAGSPSGWLAPGASCTGCLHLEHRLGAGLVVGDEHHGSLFSRAVAGRTRLMPQSAIASHSQASSPGWLVHGEHAHLVFLLSAARRRVHHAPRLVSAHLQRRLGRHRRRGCGRCAAPVMAGDVLSPDALGSAVADRPDAVRWCGASFDHQVGRGWGLRSLAQVTDGPDEPGAGWEC